MIRISNAQFHAARRRSLAAGLADSFANSPLSAAIDPADGAVVATDPLGRSTRFGFGADGFVSEVRSPLGRRWAIASDGRGRPTRFTNPAGHRLDLAYGPTGHVARIARDDRTVCTIEHDPAGAAVAYRYPDGTRTAIDLSPTGAVAGFRDRLGHAHRFEADRHDRPTGWTNARGLRTGFEHTAEALVITRPDGVAERYALDPFGQVAAVTGGDGSTFAVERDAAGRVVALAVGTDVEARFTRDAAGRITHASNREGEIRFEYDAAGRLVAESNPHGTTRHEYDAAGTLVATVAPTGERLRFDRDADLRLVRVVDWSGGAFRFDHADDDRWITAHAPSGVVSDIALTPAGQVASVTVRGPQSWGGPDLFAASYEYDVEDHVVASDDSVRGGRRFGYDPDGRLLAAGGETFGYDPDGNRVAAGGVAAEFGAIDQVERMGPIRFGHDARGNLVRWDEPGNVWDYTYDALNRMTRAERPADGRVVTFGHDAFGRRAWKRCGDLVTRFTWSGETLVREERSDGLARDYLVPPGALCPLAIRDRGRVLAVHADQIGTPRCLTDASGAVAWLVDLDAFGTARVVVGGGPDGVDVAIRFPGHYHDPETGLHDNRFRTYSPRLGRYLSRDPASYLGGLNLYAYGGNDPINQVDPLGLWPSWRTVLPIVAAVVVGVAVGVLLAPISIPAAIILGGAAAGLVGGGLNEALNQEEFCPSCIAGAALKGMVIGAAAAIPFALLPVGAGVIAYGGVGALSGGIGYVGDYALNTGREWSWGGLALSMGGGALLAGAGRYLAGRFGTPKQTAETVAREEAVTVPQTPNPGSTRSIDPNDLRFSQRSAGGSGRAAPLRESMKGGWNGPAVDAVETADGIVSIDNTRVAIARELGIKEIPVNVHSPADPLPESMLGRFGDAQTWGEALAQRTGKQRPPLPLGGTPETPRLPR